jgi:DNA-binding PadR family transcriptional regulator
MNHLSVKTLKKLRGRFIKNFMDVLVLAELKNHPMSGYDIIRFIYEKFGVLVSSGTVYSRLYTLERNGWIKGISTKRKRVYALSEESDENIGPILDANLKVQSLLRNMLYTGYVNFQSRENLELTDTTQ